MTCIAICKNRQGKLMMAGDSRVTFGDGTKVHSVAWPKVKKRNNILIGAAGHGSICSLIVDVMKVPKRGTKDLLTYMHNDFYNAVHSELTSHGYSDQYNLLKIPKSISSEAVVCIEGRVFAVSIGNDEDTPDVNGLISIDEVDIPFATGAGEGAELILRYLESNKQSISENTLKKVLTFISKINPTCDDKITVIAED